MRESARTDLCGGCRVTGIPTATPLSRHQAPRIRSTDLSELSRRALRIPRTSTTSDGSCSFPESVSEYLYPLPCSTLSAPTTPRISIFQRPSYPAGDTIQIYEFPHDGP